MSFHLSKVTSAITGLALLSSSFVVGMAPANAATPAPIAVTASTQASSELIAQQNKLTELLGYVNNLREEYGVAPVKMNLNASQEAYEWSKRMGRDNYFEHTNNNEVDPASKAFYALRGENIAQSNDLSAYDMFLSWKASTSHFGTMINPYYTSMGAGFYEKSGTDKGTYKMYGTMLMHMPSNDLMPNSYNTVADMLSGKTPLPVVDPDAKIVTPVRPTYYPSASVYTIPDVPGLRYFNTQTKKFISPGTYPMYGDITDIITEPQEGYAIARTSRDKLSNGWFYRNFEPDGRAGYRPEAPSFHLNPADPYILIPRDPAIDYYVNGVKANPGEFFAPGNGRFEVTAEIKSSKSRYYHITGYSEPWVGQGSDQPMTYSYGKRVSFDPKNGKYTIPTMENFEYFVDGERKSPGTYTASQGDTLKFEARMKEQGRAYLLNPSNFNYSYTFPKYQSSLTPTEPTFNKESYTIPSLDGIRYKVGNSTVNPGTYKLANGARVTIKAELTDPSTTSIATGAKASWDYTYSWTEVTPSAPVQNDENFVYTIPASSGYSYYVNGVKVSTGTYNADPSSSVKIAALTDDDQNEDVRLTGTSAWTFTYSAIDASEIMPLAPQMDTSAKTYTIPSQYGIQYKVNDRVVEPGVYEYTQDEMLELRAYSTNDKALVGITSWYISEGIMLTPVQTISPVMNYDKGTYTIPDVPGVDYYVNDAIVKPGTYSGNVGKELSIYADARTGFMVLGESDWFFDFSQEEVSAESPNWDNTEQWVEIPHVEGVKYAIDGVTKASGTHNIKTNSVITASVVSNRYKLVGDSKWSVDFRSRVTPSTPSADRTKGTVTIPSVRGLNYTINGIVKAPGTYSGYSGTVLVKATVVDSKTVTMLGTTSWSFQNTTVVRPASPAFDKGRNTVTIPSTAGVVYYINGKQKNKGTHSGYGSTGTVTTKASGAWYKLTGTQSWNFDSRDVVSSPTPKASTSKKTIAIPRKTGIQYYVNGKKVSQGKTYKYSSTHKVTATAINGNYRITGKTSWSYDLRTAVKPTKPKSSKSKNTITIPKKAGVQYYVNGKKVSQKKTYKYRNGTFTVTTKAYNNNYKLYSTQSWKIRL